MITKNKMFELFNDFFSRNFIRQSLFYGFYHFIMWGIHLAIISFVAFFHFTLDHRLGIIENWVFNQGWQIIFLTKMISCYVILKIICLRSNSRTPIKKILKGGFILPTKEIMLVIVLLIVTIIWTADPVMINHPEMNLFKIVTSYVCVCVFYMVDVFVIVALHSLYPLSMSGRLMQLFLFPAIFFVSNKLTFLYEQNMNFLLYFNLMFCLFLRERKKNNWAIPMIYLLLVVSVSNSIFGLDPLWGNSYSPFMLDKMRHPNEFFMLGFIIFGYILLKESIIKKSKGVR